MTNKRIEAFRLAEEAAKLDFQGAIQGLISGQESEIKRMENLLASKDMAFLMALSLTEKGKRLDKDGIQAQKIREALKGVSLCAVEKKFLDTYATQQPLTEGI